ncbi:MAG: AarF/ABC1/UbiB kinase family protein [Chloroflexi bacterium]|nr:AarF/ABC1/UbiB kinase family protein [Chloroflexota bacterium]
MLERAVRLRGHLGRYRQIAQVLVRHGFGYLISRLGLGFLVPLHWGFFGQHPNARPHSEAEHLRLAFEELGATFIKLGQVLSTRSDLLPPEYIAELSKLQDAVSPAPADVIVAQIVQELGRPLEAVFAHFDPIPLGSASIGQVHAARLHTGEEVVVKVRRPGIEDLIEEDITILFDLAHLATGRTTVGQTYDLPGIVEEFADTLRGELDYELEARNAERIRHQFGKDSSVRVPQTYAAYSTRRVLTMGRLHGIKINDLLDLDRAGIDRHNLADALIHAILKMILEDGFFHADPHPGNFLIQHDGRIALLDYGMVGRLDEETRQNLLLLFVAVFTQDSDRVIDSLLALGVVGTTFRPEHLRHDVGHHISLYYGRPLGEIDLARVLQEFLAIACRHRLQIPSRLTLLGKTLAMHQALALQLDPSFNLAKMLRPLVQRLILEMYAPQHLAQEVLPTLADLRRLATTLPRRLDRLMIQAERGNMLVNFRVPEAEHYLVDLDRMVNRLILGIITAAFIIALSILMLFYQSPVLTRFAGLLFALGFLVASGLGFWLMIKIIRGGHH